MTCLRPVIVDACPGWLRGAGELSLLQLPAGRDSLLGAICRAVLPVVGERPVVVPVPGSGRSSGSEAPSGLMSDVERIGLSPASFMELQQACEPADWLLLIPAERFPLLGPAFDAETLRAATQDPRRATRFVLSPASDRVADERILFDADARVRRVQRLYRGLTAPGAAGTGALLISGTLLSQLAPDSVLSIQAIEDGLVRRRIPCTDLLLPGGEVDRGRPDGVVALNFQLVNRDRDNVSKAKRHEMAANLLAQAPDGGPRLVGPVIVHSEAVIEPAALVIGPAVVGRGARVGRAARVCRAVIAPGARVAAAGRVRDCLVLPERRLRTRGAAVQFPPPAAQAAVGSRRHGWYPALKLGIDVAISSAAIVLLSPLLILIGLAVKLGSRGPVLYGDEREGLRGRTFRCWKFRTMRVNAAAEQRQMAHENQVDGPQFKIEHDRRVTGLGRFLRASNLDELPQLLNVVMGQMSLIGPRPSPFRENQICVAWREARLSVRPGITGLWQMCRREREFGDFHQWVYYDLLYARHFSAGLDLRILLATLLTLGGRWPVPLRWLVPGADDRRSALAAAGWNAPILELPAAPAGAIGAQSVEIGGASRVEDHNPTEHDQNGESGRRERTHRPQEVIGAA